MSDVADDIRALWDEIYRLRSISTSYYAESTTGAYLPTYFGSTTAGVTTYTTQVGDWTRIGRIAIVTGQVVWTAATGTGNARVGMPGNLAPATDSVGALYLNGVTFANSAPETIIQSSGGGQLRLFSPLTNAVPTEVAIEAAGEIRFAIIYFV